jgi:hypothetical protein
MEIDVTKGGASCHRQRSVRANHLLRSRRWPADQTARDELNMRKFLLLTTLAVAAMVAGGIAVQAQTYGPGMMGNGPDNAGRRGSYGMMATATAPVP